MSRVTTGTKGHQVKKSEFYLFLTWDAFQTEMSIHSEIGLVRQARTLKKKKRIFNLSLKFEMISY